MNLKNDVFFKNNIVFFFGSLAVSALNYLYTPVLGRLLGIAQFGEVQALLALFTQVTAIYGAIGLVAINIAAHAENEKQARLSLRPLKIWAFAIFGLVLIGAIIIAPRLHTTFPLTSYGTVIVLLILVLVGIFLLFQKALLTGQHKFGTVSVINVVIAAGRVVLGAIFVLIGWSITGAIGGTAIASVFAALLAWWLINRGSPFAPELTPDISSENLLPQIARTHITESTRSHLTYALLILLTSGFTTLLSTADIIVVKYLFPPETAGLYSGISTISNTIYFITGSVVGVLFPSIKRHASFRENMSYLAKAFGLTIFIGGGVFLGFILFPSLVVKILLGTKYLPLVHLLPEISFVILTVTFCNLLFYYFLALRNYRVIFISISSALLLCGMIWWHHEQLENIINAFLAAALFALFALASLYGYYYLQDSRQRRNEIALK